MSSYPSWVVLNLLTVCARSGTPAGHREERPVVPGTDLCGPCHGRFPRVVGDLVHYWNPLHDAIVRKPTQDYARDRVSTSERPQLGAGYNPAADATIKQITDWTWYVVRILQRENLTENIVVTDEQRVDVVLAAIATWYSRWLTHYPTLGPAWLDDVISLRTHAMQAVDPGAPAFKRVMLRGRYCTDITAETEWGDMVCGGQLVGLLRPGNEARPSVIICSADPTHTRLELRDWIHA